MAIEKFSTLLPRDGQGKRILKSKLLTALGSTGVLSPYPQNPERILERKILLQAAFNANPVSPVVPTTLLTSLAAYWKFDEGSFANRIDATGNGNTLIDNLASLTSSVGLIGNDVLGNQGAGGAGLRCANDATFHIGSGVSFTMNFWTQNAPFITNRVMVGYTDQGGTNNAYEVYYSPDGHVHWVVWNTAGVAVDVNVGTFVQYNTPTWNMTTVGYDDVAQQIFWSFSAGARSTAVCVGVKNVSGLNFTISNNSLMNSPNQISIDEMAFYRRALTVAEVTALYSAGAGLPFSSFGSTP